MEIALFAAIPFLLALLMAFDYGCRGGDHLLQRNLF